MARHKDFRYHVYQTGAAYPVAAFVYLMDAADFARVNGGMSVEEIPVSRDA